MSIHHLGAYPRRSTAPGLGCAAHWRSARLVAGALAVGQVLLGSACGASNEDQGSGGSSGAAASGGVPAAGSAGSPSGGSSGAGASCTGRVEEHPPAGSAHVAQCSPVDYDTSPPSGGNHYPSWAAFQTYDFAVPAGFLVHAIEHGGIVLWYDCPDGCGDEVAQAQTFIDALPEDALCSGTGTPRRTILVPQPGLATRWAASSWGWTLNADCFDQASFQAFVDDHYGQGREDECAPGTAFTSTPCP